MALKLRTKLIGLNLIVTSATTTLLVVVIYFLVTYQMRMESVGFLNDEFYEYSLKYQKHLDHVDILKREMEDHFTRARMAYPIFCRIYDSEGREIVKVENQPGVVDTSLANIQRALRGETVTHTLVCKDPKAQYWCAIQQLLSPKGKLFAFELGLQVDRLNYRVHRLRNYLFGTVPVIVLISLIGAIWVAHRSLKPFGQLLQSLRQIRSTSLSKRLPVENKNDELGQLAVAANEMLSDMEQSFDLIREFTGDAAHELRTPLARLLIMLEDTIHGDLTMDEARKSLDRAYEDCQHLRRLVDDLMLLARLDSGEVEGEPIGCDLHDTAHDLQELWQTIGEERDIGIEMQTEPGLTVRGYPVLLRRMLSNLFENALRHTPVGGKVRLAGQTSNGNILLEISDTGSGIGQADISKIFNRFYRVESGRQTSEGGTGLGLSICQKIVKLHQGTIEVTSQVDKGTVFKISLPLDES